MSNSANKGRVVVVGSFNVDHVWALPALPRPGETLAGTYHTGPGGKGFNQATAAARAGAATAFVCALGDDAGGRLARELAAGDGLDLRALRCAEPTGTAGIYVDADGRNTIVIGPGANAELSPAFVGEHAAALDAAQVALTQLETPLESAIAAFARARDAGGSTLLNPAPADAVASDALWALTDIATPNETEFCAQLQRRGGDALDPDALAGLDDAALHAHCRRLLAHGSVVITLGKSGCFVSHADGALRGDAQAFYRVAAAAVKAIDTTGAGDAFNGALAAALARDPDAAFGEHVRYAVRFAGLSTERAGAAAAMPSDAELRARFG
ncbi:ribokinase [Lysobacter yananisis]|uniref:Ribokinase n=1 Tax=Lysobacter yananisis TaxID=1003114 RepID=A0ABY9P936_9GAMM|nr:ribokinase [Lysobacter yananisis]WMT03531.1 ribokinase [Lysobacter yananisis]